MSCKNTTEFKLTCLLEWHVRHISQSGAPIATLTGKPLQISLRLSQSFVAHLSARDNVSSRGVLM